MMRKMWSDIVDCSELVEGSVGVGGYRGRQGEPSNTSWLHNAHKHIFQLGLQHQSAQCTQAHIPAGAAAHNVQAHCSQRARASVVIAGVAYNVV